MQTNRLVSSICLVGPIVFWYDRDIDMVVFYFLCMRVRVCVENQLKEGNYCKLIECFGEFLTRTSLYMIDGDLSFCVEINAKSSFRGENVVVLHMGCGHGGDGGGVA